ncbi:ABC transporter substrate-binding protein, partial [bacterium]|nr:ABC transporter substrate-binding protein [bacterium]
MKSSIRIFTLGLAVMWVCFAGAFPALAQNNDEPAKPKIGVTLHPYYSWVRNIVGDKMDVV